MTLSALASSSALTSITTVPAAPQPPTPAPTTAANDAPAFGKVLDRARASDEGSAKDDSTSTTAKAADNDDGDKDSDAKDDNVVTLSTTTTVTPTPSPDALTAAAGEGVTAVLALIQMANAAMTATPTQVLATTKMAIATPTVTAPPASGPSVTAPILAPSTTQAIPIALQQQLAAQMPAADTDGTPKTVTADEPDLVATADTDLPEAATTPAALTGRAAAPLDTATILAALKARAVVVDGNGMAAPAIPAVETKQIAPATVATPDTTATVQIATVSTTSVPTATAPTMTAPADKAIDPNATAQPASAIAQMLVPADAKAPALEATAPVAVTAVVADVQPAATVPAKARAADAVTAPIAADGTDAPIVTVGAHQAMAATPQPVATTAAAAPTPATAGPVAAAPIAAAQVPVSSAPADDRAEPARADVPHEEKAKADTAPVDIAAVTVDTTVVAAPVAADRAIRADAAASGQALAAAPTDNQPIQHHLDLAKDSQWLDRLARDINQAAATNGQLKFQLNPEHLGALTVEIANSAAGASIRLTADTDTARSIIADAQPRLIAEARAQGLTIAETHVELSNRQGSNGGGATMTGNGQSQGQQSSQDAKPFVRTASMMREEPAESAPREDDDRYA